MAPDSGGSEHTPGRHPQSAHRKEAPSRWSHLASAAVGIRGDIPLVILDALLAALTYFTLFALRFDRAVPDKY